MNLIKSTRKGKRFTAVFEDKRVHFGSKNGNTYIDHGDKTKRLNYIKRHQVNEDFDNPYSAGSLSRWLLWGDSTDLYKNLKEFRKKFSL
jgi:hypothetical protein